MLNIKLAKFSINFCFCAIVAYCSFSTEFCSNSTIFSGNFCCCCIAIKYSLFSVNAFVNAIYSSARNTSIFVLTTSYQFSMVSKHNIFAISCGLNLPCVFLKYSFAVFCNTSDFIFINVSIISASNVVNAFNLGINNFSNICAISV